MMEDRAVEQESSQLWGPHVGQGMETVRVPGEQPPRPNRMLIAVTVPSRDARVRWADPVPYP